MSCKEIMAKNKITRSAANNISRVANSGITIDLIKDVVKVKNKTGLVEILGALTPTEATSAVYQEVCASLINICGLKKIEIVPLANGSLEIREHQ